MKILDFLRKLAPSFDRADLVSDLAALKESVEETVLPSYASALSAGLYGSQYKAKSEWVKKHQSEFERQTRGLARGNWIEQLHLLLQATPRRIDSLTQLANTALADRVQTTGVTYSDAQLLRAVEAYRFVVDYSRRLLLIVYEYENVAIGGESTGGAYSKAEHQLFDKDFTAFVATVVVLLKAGDKVAEIIGNVPEIVVDSTNVQAVAATAGTSKLEPLRLGIIPPRWNPLFFFGRVKAEAQHALFQIAQEEKTLIELRLVQMRATLNNAPNAATEKTIEYHESRLHDLTYRIAQWEQKYA